jgi:ATP adenylyltransferase
VPQVNAPSDAAPRHDIIWAPWRIDYILDAKSDGCFLCDALGSDEDERNLVLERRETCFSIFNRYPYSNGHLLVAPNAHKAELAELDDDELTEVMRLTRDTQQLLGRAISPHGFNIGLNLGRCAGAGVPGHLHVHIVPRWDGDTNFMPVTGDTKVIVQSLAALYQLLRQQLES